jgi:kynureninase
MPKDFSPIEGAQGFQQSNPSILALASLLGSLQIFDEVGMMPVIRERSVALTSLLETLLMQSPYFIPPGVVSSGKVGFTIITPRDPQSRGAQLSLLCVPTGTGLMQKTFDALVQYGVIGDERQPDVIRLAPAPLYNTSRDCHEAALYLNKVFEELTS